MCLCWLCTVWCCCCCCSWCLWCQGQRRVARVHGCDCLLVRFTRLLRGCVAAGGRDRLLGHPVTLAVAGLISGVISTHKNWVS